ncbi:MAG: cupin domain-containing protein [Chloracidobacterium sp.]|nr:cupin domain-containing protein [Chloracidobacterium sp.]
MAEYRVDRWQRAEDPDADELSRILRSEGYHVFQWSDGAGAVYSDHTHDEDQSHWIISGRLELKCRGFGTITLEAGDRDFMPAGLMHSARVLGTEPVVYLIGSK